MTTPPLVHHADIPEREHGAGDIGFRRRRLAAAAGAREIGASHYLVAPGMRQMPVHVHGDEEEIAFVLGGEGVGYELLGDDPAGDALTYPVRAGDAIVYRADTRPHTLLAGEAGLELIVFGSGSNTSLTYLPRAGVMWAGPRWVPLDAPHPFAAEAAAGPLIAPAAPSASGDDASRPGHVVGLADCVPSAWPAGVVRMLGRSGGAVVSGLNHVTLGPREAVAPLHCHSEEEELFVVLAGTGTLRLGEAAHPLIPGDVVARPPATGVAHSIVAGDDAAGLTYLAYGTRRPGDAVYRPEQGVVRLRGLGVTLPVG